jgi:hypothetical protein
MTIQLHIPQSLLPTLERLQKESAYKDEVLESQDAIVMTLGLGPAMYLTLDGRVIIHEYMDGARPREASSKQEAFAAIVIGAKARKEPELLSILPTKTEDARDCNGCEGRGWKRFGGATEGEPVEVICWECGGVGWRDGS